MKYSEITKDGINKLMDLFYARVRKDPNLGEIFHAKIGTDEESWKKHKEKISLFWGGIFLRESGFNGAPLKAHLDLPPFPREFFDIWLGLFSQSCLEIFEEIPASMLVERATIIAERFQKMMYEFPH